MASVHVDVEAGVLRLTIDRPTSRNSLGDSEVRALLDAVREAGRDPEIRAVMLTGAHGAFCSGADLHEVAEQGAPVALDLLDSVNELVAGLIACPVPTVAAVSGPAVGVGMSLAVACDLTVAAESAYFQLPFTAIGLMPDGGATALVAASVGRQRAMRLSLLGERISAQTALSWGLIAQVHADRDLDDAVMVMMERLSSGATEALVRTADAINAATLGELGAALARERDGQGELSEAPAFTAVLHRFRQ